MDAKASLRGLKSLACLHSSHRRYSCGLSKLFCREKVELERGGGGDLSDTICFGSARWLVHYGFEERAIGQSARSPVHSLSQVRQLPRRRLTCHCLKSLDRLGWPRWGWPGWPELNVLIRSLKCLFSRRTLSIHGVIKQPLSVSAGYKTLLLVIQTRAEERSVFVIRNVDNVWKGIILFLANTQMHRW